MNIEVGYLHYLKESVYIYILEWSKHSLMVMNINGTYGSYYWIKVCTSCISCGAYKRNAEINSCDNHACSLCSKN